MEQVIRAEVIEGQIRSRIEKTYAVTITQQEEELVFADASQPDIPLLRLVPYSAAIRRNPPLPGANRLPCMADFVRVDTNGVITHFDQCCSQEQSRNMMHAMLAYQQEKKIPFTFITTKDEAFYEAYGFHYIYDWTKYRLNAEQITLEMIERAQAGETITIQSGQAALTKTTLSVLDKNALMTLAHFANAILCRQHGLFMIRSAVYYERLAQRLRRQGGNIFLIKENGKVKGYFTMTSLKSEAVQEVVMQEEQEKSLFFLREENKRPAVMARIVNMQEMLKHIPSHGKVRIAIRLADAAMAENDGLFVWYLDETGSRMERVDHEPGFVGMHPEMTTSIGDLTAFFFTYQKLKENMKFDSIYVSGPAWIHELT